MKSIVDCLLEDSSSIKTRADFLKSLDKTAAKITVDFSKVRPAAGKLLEFMKRHPLLTSGGSIGLGAGAIKLQDKIKERRAASSYPTGM